MGDALEAAGYEVATAESGALATAMLATARFDALVSDVHMPEVDGAALWRHVGQNRPALSHRMLFVTGDTPSPAASEFLALACCPTLDKPFANRHLLLAAAALVR